jgi:hypothetical protein
MKVFLSSVISGFEEYRDAAAKACRTLKHQVLRAEDYGANSTSPQKVCLAGVRDADVVVVVLGARYGDVQPSGLSATHEEFREARERRELLGFVQDGVAREAKQEEFVKEVRQWATGHYTGSFRSPSELNEKVVESLHRFEVVKATGPVDEREMLGRAQKLIPDSRSMRETALCVIVAGGPKQQVLRPAELEQELLQKELRKEGLFGDLAVLDPSDGSEVIVADNRMEIRQEHHSLAIDQLGSARIVTPAKGEDEDRMSFGLVLIEEDVQALIERSLQFVSWVLDRIDSRERLSRVVPLVSLLGSGYHAWKTRAEHTRNPNRSSMSTRGDQVLTAKLSPVSRPRASLRMQSTELAEDFTTLLRREIKP